MSAGATKIDVNVAEVVQVNEQVKRFRFVAADGMMAMPPFSGGAHTVVEMRDGGITRMNPYSLMSDPFDSASYAISVRRDDQGRGGSLFMHTKVKPGDRMTISYPVNLFGLDLRARKHLLIAGGIGITPFLAQIRQLARIGAPFELHYAVRNRELAAYADELTTRHPDQVHIHETGQGRKIPLDRLLSGQPLGTHVYICGPKGMIEQVKACAWVHGWPKTTVHSEEFLAPQSGKPFTVHLAASNKTIHVGAHQSLLEAIEAAGVDAPYLCRGGACGQCETDVLRHEGSFVHCDHWLDNEQKNSGRKIMPCVSRFEGNLLVLDR